jgi:tripartite-type tricarboxylate transporter receptor subunit TctC
MPETQDQLLQQGAYALKSTPEQAAARVREEIRRWATVIRDSNITMD